MKKLVKRHLHSMGAISSGFSNRSSAPLTSKDSQILIRTILSSTLLSKNHNSFLLVAPSSSRNSGRANRVAERGLLRQLLHMHLFESLASNA